MDCQTGCLFYQLIFGIHAWYRTDHNNSFTYFDDLSFERNDTVAVSDQLLAYSFDENNESIIFDESGEGLHGNVIGDAFRSSGKFGGSISFDGDNDAVVLPKVEFMDSPQSFSISMWFKRLEDNQSTPPIIISQMFYLLSRVPPQMIILKLELQGQKFMFIWTMDQISLL